MMKLEPRRIPLTENSFKIYENIDGHRYGALFGEWFSLDHGFIGDLWGFGDTKTEALSHLVRVTEEYNALYYKTNIRFVPTFWEPKRI